MTNQMYTLKVNGQINSHAGVWVSAAALAQSVMDNYEAVSATQWRKTEDGGATCTITRKNKAAGLFDEQPEMVTLAIEIVPMALNMTIPAVKIEWPEETLEELM